MALRGDGHVVFLDDTDLPPANTFHERIRQAIEDADLMVFLVSPSSQYSGMLTMENLLFLILSANQMLLTVKQVASPSVFQHTKYSTN